MILKTIFESTIQAFQQLVTNKLRTLLSLLGITIGVFCIIAVQTGVDSLKQSILDSFKELGADILYVSNTNWGVRGGSSKEDMRKNPLPSVEEFEYLRNNLDVAEDVTFAAYIRSKAVQFYTNSVSGMLMLGVSERYEDMFALKLAKGRFFTRLEHQQGMNRIVLGHALANELFQSIDPIGKTIKVGGESFTVIGVLEAQGKSMFKLVPYDNILILPLHQMQARYNLNDKNIFKSLAISKGSNVTMDALKDDIIRHLRGFRLLRPISDNNFYINNISAIQQATNKVFGQMNVVGIIIGIFSLIVGLFSVANIMFVSVKERTKIIGIKKSLGAPSYAILIEFLLESIVLCLIGGLIGLLIIFLGIQVFNQFGFFTLILTYINVVFGVAISIFTGIISGLIPAFQASRMSPVEAMRN